MNEEQKAVKWVTMATNPNAIIFLGLQNGINNAESLSKETLVDRVNKKLAVKTGVEVPAELIINKAKPKLDRPANTGKKQRTSTPREQRQPREGKATTPAAPVDVDGKEVITIRNRMVGGKLILEGRRMVVTEQKDGSLLGYLIKDSDGTLQRSLVTMPLENCARANQQQAVAAQ